MFIYKLKVSLQQVIEGHVKGQIQILIQKHFRDLTFEVKFMVYKLASNLTPHSNEIGFTQIKK